MAEAPDPSPAPAGPRRPERRGVPWWGVVLIVLAVLVAGEAFARIVGPNIPRRAGSEERLLIKSDQIYRRGSHATDVVVLGSSEAAGGVAPKGLDRAASRLHGAYNAALPGAELGVTRQWADRIVVPHLRPKVAVISIMPMSVLAIDDAKGAAQERAAIDSYRTAIRTVDPGGLGSLTWQLRQRSDLVRYRPYLRSPVLTARGARVALSGGKQVTTADRELDRTMEWTTETDPDRVARNTGPDGQIYDYRQPSIPTEADPVGAALYRRFGTYPVDLSKLEALVADLRADGVEPVIALAPADRGPLERGGADLGPLDDVARQIEAWGKEHHVPVSDEFTKDWSSDLFHDRNHLDPAGAKVWSAKLGRWLDEQCASGALRSCAG